MQRLLGLVLLGFVFAISGCSSGTSKLSTVDVKTTLFVDGKPFGPAQVNLSPPDAAAKYPPASGSAKEDGTVQLYAYRETPGVVPGTYNVTIMPDAMAIGKPFPAVKPATVEVKAGDTTLEIKLESDPNAKPSTGLVTPTP